MQSSDRDAVYLILPVIWARNGSQFNRQHNERLDLAQPVKINVVKYNVLQTQVEHLRNVWLGDFPYTEILMHCTLKISQQYDTLLKELMQF